MLDWVLLWCLLYTLVHLAEVNLDLWFLLKILMKSVFVTLLLLGLRLLIIYSSNLSSFL